MGNNYLILDKSDAAAAISAKEAQARGCDGIGTKYWWDVKQTKDGKFAVVFGDLAKTDDATPLGLAVDEKAAATDKVEFPVIVDAILASAEAEAKAGAGAIAGAEAEAKAGAGDIAGAEAEAKAGAGAIAGAEAEAEAKAGAEAEAEAEAKAKAGAGDIAGVDAENAIQPRSELAPAGPDDSLAPLPGAVGETPEK